MDKFEKDRRLKELLSRFDPELMETRDFSNNERQNFSDDEVVTINGALESLAVNRVLDQSEQGNLEAIIHRRYRPSVFVIDDSFEQPSDPWKHFAFGEKRRNIERALNSIGRIELLGNNQTAFGGTGFVVSNDLVMTNRHVAESFATGLGTKFLRFRPERGAAVDFKREVMPCSAPQVYTVKHVELIHPHWDMALLRVDVIDSEHKSLTMSNVHPEDLYDRDIAVIGFPSQDSRNDIDLQNMIFGGVFDVKRLLPGKIGSCRSVQSFSNNITALTHDASTLGGCSGSALIDVETGDIVGLHFAGIYLDANFSISSYDLVTDRLAINAGLKPADSVKISSEWFDKQRRFDNAVENKLTSEIANSDASKKHPMNVGFSSETEVIIPLTLKLDVSSSQVQLTSNGHNISTPLEEGLFGLSSTEKNNVVFKARYAFSTKQLRDPNFSWLNALSTAAASHLAYSNVAEINLVCKDQWSFSSCDFIKANDTEVFISSNHDTVLVSFRGTAGARDLLRDLSVFSTKTEHGRVHSGFYYGFKQADDQIRAVFRRIQAQYKDLVITGHSLGGALATIAASQWELDYHISSVYTFGQPAVGRNHFKKRMQSMDNCFFRVVNDDDIITKVPPTYRHVDQKFLLKPSTKKTNNTQEGVTNDDSMMSEEEFYAMQIEFNSTLSTNQNIQEGIVPSFIDHSSLQYMKKILTLI